jgi:hypothetical protein
LVAHGWAAPPLVDPAPRATSDALARFVEGLAELPGAEYVLAVDAEGHRVLGEAGGPPGADLAVLDWARRVAAVAHERHHALEDLVLTTERAFHVVRLVPADPEAPEDRSAWVGVRIDAARGNLARARRAVAATGAPASPSRPRPLSAGAPDSHRPSPRFAPFTPAAPSPRFEPGPATPSVTWAPSGPAAPSGPSTGAFPAAMPGPAGAPPTHPTSTHPTSTHPTSTPSPELPSPRAPEPEDGPRHGWPRPEDRAAAKAQLARELAAFTPSPRSSVDEEDSATPEPASTPPAAPGEDEAVADAPSARRLPLTIRQASRWRDDVDADDGPSAWVPTARTSTETGTSLPPPAAASLFTPAAPVPAPCPTREDDTGEMAAPPAAAAVVRPRPYIPDPGLASGPVPDPWPAPAVPDPWPAPTAAGPDPAVSDDAPDLPRRRPGAQLAPRPAAPRSDPTVHPVAAPVGTAAFTTEPSVLRRLLDGLRRLT